MKCCADCKHAGYSDSTGTKCVNSLNCIHNDYCKFEKEDEDILIKRNIKTNSQKRSEKKEGIQAIIFVISTILFFIFLIWTTIGSIIYRFSNPELTSTQLIIWTWNTYTLQYIYIIIWFIYTGRKFKY